MCQSELSCSLPAFNKPNLTSVVTCCFYVFAVAIFQR
jgi:hypothetical protein